MLATCWALAFCAAVQSQSPSQTPQQPDDVIRISTELVQTDVMVFDRRGHFVDGIKPDEFVFTLDGARREVSSLSRVTSGSRLEAAQLAAARTGSATPILPSDGATVTEALNPGRLIFFFIDDLHLSGESLARGRKALSTFVDTQMSPNDQVAIISTSGQVGFLQQLTDNPTVLHAAIARLNYKRNPEAYAGSTRISEAMASQIADEHNQQLFAYLMDSVKIEYGMGVGALRGAHNNDSAGQAARLLNSRIGQIRARSKADTADTLEVLRSLMESSAALPGRKLIFFLSDGFIIDPRGSNALTVLHQLTQTAAHTGAVIYTMDTRGTFANSGVDASTNDFVDMTSRHVGVSIGETTAPREPLSVLADETGGRAIFNSNSIDDAMRQAVRETSDYYVLAWRPDSENERNGKAKMEVSIQGRPDLRVRLRRNYFVPSVTPTATTPSAATARKTTPETQLLAALGSAHPHRSLPTSVSLGYVNNPGAGNVLQASMQIAREAFNFDPNVQGQKSEVDVIGAAIDDRGLIYTFKQVLTVLPQTPPQSALTPVVWTQQLTVRPGLYQVRVAVRERQTGRTGSALQWLEVPAAAPNRLSMSSLFLGERRAEKPTDQKGSAQPVRVDVDHRFARSSVLRFQTYVYNAARAAGMPDVWIEARILHGNEPVITMAPNRIPPDVTKDSARLPYWTEISLEQLPSGTYTLHVSATDRMAKSTTTQRISFSVE